MTCAGKIKSVRSPRGVGALAGLCIWLSALAGCSAQEVSGVIEQINPPPGSSGLGAVEPITFRFDLPLDPGSVNEDNVTARRSDTGEPVPVRVSRQKGSAEISVYPVDNWPVDGSFELCLGSGVRTSAGGRVAAYRVDPDLDIFEFLTDDACFEFGTLSGLTVRRAYLVPDENKVMVYFSRPVEHESISTADVTVMTGEGDVGAEFRFSPTRNRLAVYLVEPLDSAHPVSIQLPGSIRTADGEQLEVGAGETLRVRYPSIRIK